MLRLSEKALTHLETTTYRKRVGSYNWQFSGKIIEEDNNSLICEGWIINRIIIRI